MKSPSIYTLASPDLGDGGLAERHIENNRVVLVSLFFGDPLAVAGPAMTVTTVFGGRASRPDPDGLIRSECDRLYDHAGVETSLGPSELIGSTIHIGQLPYRSSLLRSPPLWVAAVEAPRPDHGEGSVRVEVIGRGLAPNGVVLGVTSDFAPLWEKRTELLHRLAESQHSE
jgi:hypothetical protein